jgi:hypothetical protein
MHPYLMVVKSLYHSMLYMETVPPALIHAFMLVIIEARQAFLSICSAHCLAALLFLFCICYFKQVHNASIFRLLLNASVTELRTQKSCQAEQKNIPADETFHSAWDGASISGPIMRDGPVAGPVLLAQESHITEATHHAATGGHIKGPTGTGTQAHLPALLFFKFPEMSCLDLGWILLAGNKSAGSLRPHLHFSCLPRKAPIFSMVTNLIKGLKSTLHLPASSLLGDFNVKCPHVAFCQIWFDFECRHTSSRGPIAFDTSVGSLGWFSCCVFIALVASYAGLIYYLQGHLGSCAGQFTLTSPPWLVRGVVTFSKDLLITAAWHKWVELFPPTPPFLLILSHIIIKIGTTNESGSHK